MSGSNLITGNRKKVKTKNTRVSSFGKIFMSTVFEKNVFVQISMFFYVSSINFANFDHFSDKVVFSDNPGHILLPNCGYSDF